MNKKGYLDPLFWIFMGCVIFVIVVFIMLSNYVFNQECLEHKEETSYSFFGGCMYIADDGTELKYYKYEDAKEQFKLAKILEANND